MRWLAIVAVIASCERSESPPPPVPRDAEVPVDAAPACSRRPDPQRLRALDGWRDAAKPGRSPVDGSAELTDAYLALELAYAYARLGADARALVEKTKAHRMLDEPARADRVHRVLLATYDARIAQAQRCQPVDTPLPPALEAEVAKLDGGERIRLDRLRDQIAQISRTLGE